MPEFVSKKGRARDAKGTREAILAAAEAVFAERGFDGARVDAIASTSSYNKSLIGQYFGDKLGLYAEVIKRVDGEVDELLARAFAPLLTDEAAASNAQRLRTFLKTMTSTFFDYLLERPRLVKILTWEMAGGWQMFAKIVSQFPTGNSETFETFFHKAWKAGLLRSDFFPRIQFSLALQVCLSYFAFFPVYQMLIADSDKKKAIPADENLSSESSLARAREYLADLVVAGMMNAPNEQ
jgi:TetR/AcrR family transcriptional regulator